MYPRVEKTAETALKLIMDVPDALNGTSGYKEFLKKYDECRFKFIEMSKAFNVKNN